MLITTNSPFARQTSLFQQGGASAKLPEPSPDRVTLGGLGDSPAQTAGVLAGGAAMFAGIGAVVGCAFGNPGAGALKGLGIFALYAAADALLDNPAIEEKVLNWSKTLPGSRSKTRDSSLLFAANLATNALLISGVGAGVGAILGGTTGALVGAGVVLAGGALYTGTALSDG